MTNCAFVTKTASVAAQLKRKQVRVYLDPTDEARLERLIKNVATFSESSLMTALLSAALKSCSDAGNRITLPIEFTFKDAPENRGSASADTAQIETPKRR